MKLFAVIDKKAKNVVSVFASASSEVAQRSFLMLLSGPQNLFTDFPEDFALYPVADLSFSGNLVVAAHGHELLREKGFAVNEFTVTEPVCSGSDFDKRYLKMLHDDRAAYNVKEEDNSND